MGNTLKDLKKGLTCECLSIISLATPNICSASSLVGDTTITPVPFLGLNLSACNISIAGTKNASVFPDPVLAAPSTSRPARIGGIDFCWMGVRFVKPIDRKSVV